MRRGRLRRLDGRLLPADAPAGRSGAGVRLSPGSCLRQSRHPGLEPGPNPPIRESVPSGEANRPRLKAGVTAEGGKPLGATMGHSNSREAD
jgi:hypothetical protein